MPKNDPAHEAALWKSELAEAVGARYGYLAADERQRVAEILFREMTKNIRQGRELAFVHVDSNSEIDLSIYFVSNAIERVVQEVTRRRLSR